MDPSGLNDVQDGGQQGQQPGTPFHGAQYSTAPQSSLQPGVQPFQPHEVQGAYGPQGGDQYVNGVHQLSPDDPSQHQPFPGQQPGVSDTPVGYSVTNQAQVPHGYGAGYPEMTAPSPMHGQSQPGSAVSNGYMTPGQPHQHLGGDPMYAHGYLEATPVDWQPMGINNMLEPPFTDGSTLDLTGS